MTKPTMVIAEAGVNHNGELHLAKKLVEAASKAGADVVKFQTFQASELVTEHAEKAAYQKKGSCQSQRQLKMLETLELKTEDHIELIKYCNQLEIEFLSTAFDLKSIEVLKNLGLRRWKIPSGEITNLPYLRQIGSQRQPIIMSTGMANLGEIEEAITILEQAGSSRSQIKVLHCTTEYPTPVDEVNLRAMQTMANTFGVEVGYSDHTNGIAVPIAAVALGASVIEKHITLDRNLAGPDHIASLEPEQFTAMVEGIRSIEKALGDGIKRPTPSEQANLQVVRKSLVAARAIRAGEVFSETNLKAKRPGTGISPMRWDEWIGKYASRNFEADELIS